MHEIALKVTSNAVLVLKYFFFLPGLNCITRNEKNPVLCFEEILRRREICQRGSGSRQRKKKNNAGKNAGKTYRNISPPHFFFQDLKELDILVRSSAGIVLMYYSFPFVMKKNSDHSAFLGNQSI